MNKTLCDPRGDIKCTEVFASGTIINKLPNGKSERYEEPAVLSISQCNAMPDKPILSICIGSLLVAVEFNSDFPLLFEEGIELWK